MSDDLMSTSGPRPTTPGGRAWREAGVLVPVYRDPEGVARIVVIRRAEGGLHGGHLAFPGGVREPGDATLRDTALREADEEIGLPIEHVTGLEPLPVIETRTTGYRIAPYLARIVRPPVWRPAPAEIAEILEVAVRDLTRPDAHGDALEHLPGWTEPRRIAFYRVGSYRLWGASYRILHPLLARLTAGELEL